MGGTSEPADWLLLLMSSQTQEERSPRRTAFEGVWCYVSGLSHDLKGSNG